ncbi:MAG: hypothetical protein J7L25_04920, partial [Deltaproteobacteria bacterium]|nr:hypothetical protein [Candidatus Tharpella aukensis]
ILDRLERDGLIARQATPNDRRALYIRLTERSRSLRDDLTHIYNDTNQQFLSQLTDHEREVFDNILDKLKTTKDDQKYEEKG